MTTSLGQITLMNIVSEISQRLNIPMDEIKQNVTRTSANAFLAKE